MKCLRCSYCCIMLDVIIIKPEFVKENLILYKLPVGEAFMHKPSYEACPHLSFVDDMAVCKIHNYKWYTQTPCFKHDQISASPDDPCRMGEYLLKKNPDHWKEIKDKCISTSEVSS
jgi:hypothetical protein